MTTPDQYQYGTCRDLRHRWSRKTKLTLSGDAKVLRRVTTCNDCFTKREERFAVKNMKVTRQLGSSYIYPKGYTIKGGGVKAMDFRAAALDEALITNHFTLEG